MAYILFKIAGIDCTGYIARFELNDTYGSEVTTLNLILKRSVFDDVALEIGQSIYLYHDPNNAVAETDTYRIFKGTVENLDIDKAQVKLECYDELAKAGKIEINRTFLSSDAEAGKISEIVKTLLTTAGVAYSSTSITDTGTVYVLNKFVCKNVPILERLKKLAESLSYQIYFNPHDQYAYFEPQGIRNTVNLTVGTEIKRRINWEKQTDDMVNELKIIGARQDTEYTETFNGDGTTKDFILENVPESTKAYVGGTLKKGGLDYVSTDAEYYIDKATKKISFLTAPGSGTGNVVIDYTYSVPIPLRLHDDASINTYGKYSKTITLTDVLSIDDALQRGTQYLTLRKNPNYHATEVTVANTITTEPGDTVRITDGIEGITDDFVCIKKKTKFPSGIYELEVGSQKWQFARLQDENNNRIKRLEELQFENEDVLTEVLQGGEKNLILRPYSLDVKVQSMADSFILGDATNGILGNGEIISEFDDTSGGWTCDASSTITPSTAQYISGAGSVKWDWTATGLRTVETHGYYADWEPYTGLGMGLFADKGVVGLWIYQSVPNSISSIALRVGNWNSTPSNMAYLTVPGVVYGSTYGYSFANTGWLYVVFYLQNGTNYNVINWNTTNYIQLRLTTATTTGTVYIDYHTVSAHYKDKIALNGLGERTMAEATYYSAVY